MSFTSIRRISFRQHCLTVNKSIPCRSNHSIPAQSAQDSQSPDDQQHQQQQKREENENSETKPAQDKISIHFRKKSGTILTGVGKEGENLLDVVVNNNLDLDGFGACEGTLACSTCHLILSQKDYDGLGNSPTDEELDMLDLAYGLTETSRLGCQVRLKRDLDGMTVDVPEGINDVRSDT